MPDIPPDLEGDTVPNIVVDPNALTPAVGPPAPGPVRGPA
jgi:hypothetical protein